MIRSSCTRCVVAVAAVCFWGPMTLAKEHPYSLPEIVSGMEQFERQFRQLPSWLVEYVHERRNHHPPPGIQQKDTRWEVLNAKKGDWIYVHRIAKHRRDRLVQTWCVWRDGICTFRIFNNYQIFPEIHPAAWEYLFYTDTLFLDMHPRTRYKAGFLDRLLGGVSPSQKLSRIMLPESIKKQAKEVRLRPQLETIDGHQCVVVEIPEKDILWLDPQIGFLCRRRQVYQKPGVLFAEYRNMEFKQWLPGLWLPLKQVVVRYNLDSDPPEYHGKVRYVERNYVMRIQLGNVPDELFVVPVPESGLIYDHIRGVQYRKYPAGTKPKDALNMSITLARDEAGVTARMWSRPIVYIVCWSMIGIAGVLLLVSQVRKLRNSPPAASEE